MLYNNSNFVFFFFLSILGKTENWILQTYFRVVSISTLFYSPHSHLYSITLLLYSISPHSHPDSPHYHQDFPLSYLNFSHFHPDSPHSHPDPPYSHPDSPHSHPDSPHSHPNSQHSHPDSSHSYPDSPYSHPDFPHSHPIPHISRVPSISTPIPTLIPRVSIISVIPFPDSPFRLLQIADVMLRLKDHHK